LQEPTNTTEDIFATTNEEGVIVRRLHSISRYLFVVSIVTSILAVYLFIPDLALIRSLVEEQPRSKFALQGIASGIYTVCFTILFPVQVYFYWRFVQTTKNMYAEGHKFNSPHALKFLLKNAWVSCITFSLNVVYSLFAIGINAWVK
jgi:hypothetical protein